MKYERVGRMPLAERGRLVAQAMKMGYELKRINRTYAVVVAGGEDPSSLVIRRCSLCRGVDILSDTLKQARCPRCWVWGEVEKECEP